MKKFSSLFKILKAVLIVAVAVLLARSVYNGVRYSRWSSLSAAQVLSESGGRYEEFLSFAEDRSDGAHETFLNLCGKLDWKQLSLSGSESVAFTCDSLLGTLRLLIVDSASGRSSAVFSSRGSGGSTRCVPLTANTQPSSSAAASARPSAREIV